MHNIFSKGVLLYSKGVFVKSLKLFLHLSVRTTLPSTALSLKKLTFWTVHNNPLIEYS